MNPQTVLEELWELVRAIPSGKCASYGELGRMLHNPASGFMVGRWMAQAPPDLPWWRVVGKDGRLPIHKRDPRWAEQQRLKLESEGVEVGESIDMERFGWC